jgi:Ni/Co efflux regulator RcnB
MMYLNHSKLELKKMSKPALVSIGHGILKRLPKTALVNTVYKLEQLAKSKGIKSIGKIARKAGRKAKSAGRKVKTRYKRAKSARTRPGSRYKSVVPGKRIGRKYKKYTRTKKRRGGKKLHFTKTGQPYVLLASGQARFVKR